MSAGDRQSAWSLGGVGVEFIWEGCVIITGLWRGLVVSDGLKIEHRLNATAYLSMLLTCPSLYDYIIIHHVTKLKSSQIGFLNMTISSLYSKWPPQSPDLIPIEHLWDVVEREIRIMDVQPPNLQQLRDAIMSIWKKKFWAMFPKPCWIYALLRQFWRQKWVRPGTSKVYLIKWPVSVYYVNKNF